MRVAVIGAGIVGVTTAYELMADGHQVTVFERRSSVAEETSFANAGVVAPAYVAPWAAPGMPRKVLAHLLSQHSPVRLARPWAKGQASWMWRWWRACRPGVHAQNRQRMYRLAQYSQQRLQTLEQQLQLEHEQSRGYLVLLRSARELTLARQGLKDLAELGCDFKLLDATHARQVEPGLNPKTALHAAIHLPSARVGNCRQFAHLLKAESQRRGVQFLFQRSVLGLQAAQGGGRAGVRLRHLGSDGRDEPQDEDFDAVVVCAAMGAPALLAPLGMQLPLAAVHGYSLTAPLRVVEAHPELGPQAAVMDERYKVAVSRLGGRVRVAGGAELGGRLGQQSRAAVATLYKVLNDWYPGATQLAQVQVWKGARPMLPDGPPVLGAGPAPGVWLNLGHGSSGWALACGSARVLADQIAGRLTAIDTEGLGLDRLQAG